MKKKVLALLLTAAVTASLLAGCGSKENPSNTDASSVQKTENTAETQKESAETTKKDPPQEFPLITDLSEHDQAFTGATHHLHRPYSRPVSSRSS